MTTPHAPHQRRLRQLAAAVALAAAVGCTNTDSAAPRPPPDEPAGLPDGWASTTMLCTNPGDADNPIVAAAGDVLRLDSGAGALEASGCTTLGGADTVDVAATDAWFVIATGADRFNVEVEAVTDRAGTPHLDVRWDTLGENCSTTMEYRGELIAVVTAPAGTPTPTAEIRANREPC